MNSQEIIDRYECILKKDTQIATYCKDKLYWASSRRNDWNMDQIRVGVIGVTSSGKSTLINAILGSDILSSAVAPSSGQLVCCSYGPNYTATIRFENGTKKILSGADFSTSKLMEYSDERMNPKNIKKVTSIELQSPNYDLGKDVLLIDSPGLDAYGLEAHEKITLETLVPTIDVCVYVTTMKTNSDKKAAEILNTVARYDCPLIMVQNMLDSVRPSPSGDKTSKQVAQDHYKRLSKIVEQSNIKDKKTVEIVQLSAEHAKQWRVATFTKKKATVSKVQYEKSNFDQFIATLQQFLQNQKPRIELQRLSSIETSIREFLVELDGKCSAKKKGSVDTFAFGNLKKELSNVMKVASLEYHKILNYGDKRADELIASICENANSYNIESYIEETNQFVNEVGLRILKVMQTTNGFFQTAAQKVNIPTRDLLKSPSLDFYRDVKVEKKTVIEKHKVKDSGILGWGRRVRGFFSGDSSDGYHYDKEQRVETDLEATQLKLVTRLEEAVMKYAQVYEQWKKTSVDTIESRILGVIHENELAYKERQKASIEQTKLSQLAQELKKLQADILRSTKQLHPKEEKRTTVSQQMVTTKKVNADPIALNLLKLSKDAIRKQHWCTMKTFIQKEKLDSHKAVIIGWDTNCINEFIWQSGVKEWNIQDLSKEKKFSLPKSSSRCIFILVNTIQFGAAQKQIMQLNLSQITNQNDYIVWVVQDLQEIINSGDLGDALNNMTLLTKQTGIQSGSKLWLIHENPMHNIAFVSHQYQPVETIKDENEMINQMRSKYSSYCDDDTIKTIVTMFRNVHMRRK